MDWEEYDIQIVRLVFIFFSPTISRGGEGYPTIHHSTLLQIILNSMDRITFCIVLLVLWAVATGIYFYCQRVKVGDEQDDNTNRQPQQIDNEASTDTQQETEEEQQKKEERKQRILQVLQTKQIVNDKGDNSTGNNSCTGDSGGEETILISDVHNTCGEECNICLAPFNIGDYISTKQQKQNSPAGIRCRHIFHTTCIKQWLLDHDNDGCPICRSSFKVERVINSEANTVAELDSQQDVNNV